MKVTIWDLDYYYAKEKKNIFNPDVMKISSYHKQCGDTVMLVRTEDDINRPYDLYYIIKNNAALPMPPMQFFMSPRVRWWGKAVRARVNWKMPDVMLACRPDYLIYPEHNTKEERSEQVRFFNNQAQLLPKLQDWTNSYKNKMVIVTDTTMWYADKKDIIVALKSLLEVKKVSFLEPIWVEKLLSDKELMETFLELKFSPGSQIIWSTIKNTSLDEMIEFRQKFKQKFPAVACGIIELDWRNSQMSHWESREAALDDFNILKHNIIKCKENNIAIKIRMPQSRFETPYYELFETIADWSNKKFQLSWLEYITIYKGFQNTDFDHYWNTPKDWNEIFRDLLRQTYDDADFLLLQMKDRRVSRIRIPWDLWKEQFKYGL